MRINVEPILRQYKKCRIYFGYDREEIHTVEHEIRSILVEEITKEVNKEIIKTMGMQRIK